MKKAQEYLRALSEPLRLRILWLLHQSPLSVSELTQILKVSQPNVSHHLKALRSLSLVDSTRKGSTTYYFSPVQPQLPTNVAPFFLPIWQNLADYAKELDEYSSDVHHLGVILTKRNPEGNHTVWELWRSLQPDIPFTQEVLLAGISRRGLAVDVGCGDGNFLELLNLSHDVVIGVDISHNQLQAASLRTKSKKLLQGDAIELPLKTFIADSVYLRMILQFIPDAKKALQEAWSLVKLGGCLSIIDYYRPDVIDAVLHEDLLLHSEVRHFRKEGMLFLFSIVKNSKKQ